MVGVRNLHGGRRVERCVVCGEHPAELDGFCSDYCRYKGSAGGAGDDFSYPRLELSGAPSPVADEHGSSALRALICAPVLAAITAYFVPEVVREFAYFIAYSHESANVVFVFLACWVSAAVWTIPFAWKLSDDEGIEFPVSGLAGAIGMGFGASLLGAPAAAIVVTIADLAVMWIGHMTSWDVGRIVRYLIIYRNEAYAHVGAFLTATPLALLTLLAFWMKRSNGHRGNR